MRPEDLLTEAFLKQFKSLDELNNFLGQLQKRGLEKMLEGELDGHLGYAKHGQSDNSNARNGYGKKKIRTSYGESEIQVPRDRDAKSDCQYTFVSTSIMVSLPPLPAPVSRLYILNAFMGLSVSQPVVGVWPI